MDNDVRIWNTRAAVCVHVLTGHDSGIRTIATGSGQHNDIIVTGSFDQKVDFVFVSVVFLFAVRAVFLTMISYTLTITLR